MSLEYIQIISTIFLIFFTAFYAWQSRKSVKESEKSRMFDFLPILSIDALATSHDSIKISVQNIGRGLAQHPKICLPFYEYPHQLKNLAVGHSESTDFKVHPTRILSLSPEKRRIKVKYRDVFGRLIMSWALIASETTDEKHPRKNHLKVEIWQLEIPK